MREEELAKRISAGIEECEEMNGTHVFISKADAIELVRILRGGKAPQTPVRAKPGQKLFYCADCGQSFSADPREDRENYEKWHYHAWYAECPRCHKEVRQTDRYWR